jgi:hypothetical protein
LKLALRAQAKWKRLDGLKTWRAHSPTAVKTNTTRGIALMHECRVFYFNTSLTVIVLLARQFGTVGANGGNQFGWRNFVAHFAVYAWLALIDLDQKNAFAVFCRFEAQRAEFARRCVVVFGEQGH